MICRITGLLNRVLDDEVRLQVGQLEYQVLVPEFVRRSLQGGLGGEITLHTFHYLDGNPMQGKVVPRLVGFSTERNSTSSSCSAPWTRSARARRSRPWCDP